jgi:group II intron reverse transcriptase/maturase
LRTTGYPKGRKLYGYGESIVPAPLGRDSGNRLFSSIVPSLNSFPDAVGTLETLGRKSTNDPNQLFYGLISAISNPKVIILAYELIKSKQGNTTRGINHTTLDGIDLDWIDRISKQIQAGKFKFKPVRRTYIPKTGKPNEKRPLGIANPPEKVVQKALQLILEAIYEPLFADYSHGFRPNRSCHTALKSCYAKLNGIKWVIEGGIAKCFDKIPHNKLMSILGRKIKCQKTIALLNSALKAGFIELGGIAQRQLEGTPQGSVLSPLLCNIYMNELDLFMQDLIDSFNRGKVRQRNPVYRKLSHLIRKASLSGDIQLLKSLRLERWNTLAGNPIDPNFRRCIYIRYADDFIIGTIGSKAETLIILEKVRTFLRNDLGLDLNMDKTHVIHFRKNPVPFLGAIMKGYGHLKGTYIIQITHSGSRRHLAQALPVRLEAPIKKIFDRLVTGGFFRKVNSIYKPIRVGRLFNLDMPDILKNFNNVIRGYMNYYTFADNRSSLGMIMHGLKWSCALTLRSKFKLNTTAAVFKKFGKYLTYKTEVYSKGKPTTKKISLVIPDTFRRLKPNERFRINQVSAPEIPRVD